MALSWRFSALADRHRALGSNLEDWSGMGTAWTYAKDIQDEHTAIRTKAGLMDVSGLKKLHLVGPHAIAVLDYVTTRNMAKVTPGRSVYACILNEKGFFTDDCIVYRTGPNAFMVVHGSGTAHEEITKQCIGRNVAVLFDDDLHDLSLQGPVAVDFLAKHVPGIRDLKYFHHMQTTLFGAPVMISRTGYTGERGYEIFVRGQDAPLVWDTILAEGAEMGIIPCCFSVLDMLRVESYLLFYPYDNSQMYPFADQGPGDSLWELGLDFTVSPGKTGFRGAEEHARLKGKERFRIYGLLLEAEGPCDLGDAVFAGDRQVGVVTCPSYSAITRQSMAIARLEVGCAVHGTALTVGGKAIPAVAHKLPFDDPEKKKRTAIG
ncbi:aminomethyl transferase family protein [Frigidibacter albus]|uniref:Aminomethyl transferase family protein n=1 Tax=Frigidibacter albus TaxID=1465486 RepID=A0A6L8VEP0_9RHOB|nr:aminomethyltransferase family protein [Frigidibacter albus]MZQ88693.1 aminomethyl transferase family protein [Frigidibacter albus]NBE30498.1 aminomethyl transferase family protein [Frigidibacter albus]